MITEILNKRININLPTFVCDNPLSNKIPQPLPKSHSFMVFAGSAGSGKTSTALGLLTTKGKNACYRGVFHNIIIMIPKSSLSSLKKNPFKDLDDEKIFNKLTFNSLNEVYDMVKNYSDENENTLLYIDDMTASLKDNDVQKLFSLMINNRRHLRLSIWMLVQTYKSVPLTLRKTITHLFQYKPNNKAEVRSIFDELLFYPKEIYEEVLQYVYKKKYDFLFANIQNRKLYRKFNELILENKI